MGLDVIRLMNFLQIPRAHIIGYSMGAAITAQLLSEHPERFLTATVGGGAGSRILTPESEKRRAYLAALDRGEMAPDVAARNNDPAALAAVQRSFSEWIWDQTKDEAGGGARACSGRE
jgi:pimeloyl-ACP methyl ester carboxylesterase